MNRILAIEPDITRGLRLRRLVRQHLDADFVIAASADAAITAMAGRQPDLILTSILLAAPEEQALVAHLRANPALSHLPVLTVPAVNDVSTPDARPAGLFGRLLGRRHAVQTWPAYNVNAVITRIEEALEQSKIAASAAAEALDVQAEPIAAEAPATSLVVIEPGDTRAFVIDSEFISSGTRHRARRWTPSDLPWLSAVKVSWGHRLQLLNISSSGMLVESGLRLSPGTVTTLQISGPDLALVVPARVLRCRVIEVDSLGVKYETAAVFERPIDALASLDDDAMDAATHLSDLVESVREHATRGAAASDLRREFEAGVLGLITAGEVRLRDVPVVENDGRESVYFTIPTFDAAPAVLQVTFNPNEQPSADDFAVMLAAADVAGGVLPLTGTTRRSVVRSETPLAARRSLVAVGPDWERDRQIA